MPAGMEIATWCWAGFFAYWLIAARKTKQVRERESIFSRLSYFLPSMAAGYLMFARRLPWSDLTRPWLATSVVVEGLGLVLIVGGLGFAVWARLHLGQNWSGTVTVKVNHELIRSGPYAWVRHPIYSGMLLAMAGTALENRELRGVIATLLLVTAFWMKSRIEDAAMARTFGAEYEGYRRSTGALIPHFSRRPA